MAVAVKVGPWGAPGGQPEDIHVGSMPQSLVRITICSSEAENGRIFGFSFMYVDQNGMAVHVGPWGYIDQQETITNIEMGAGEYLHCLSGTANEASGVTWLKLVTNQHEYEVGHPVGPRFSVPLGNGKVVAFFGRSKNTQGAKPSIMALGIYVPVMEGSPVKIGPWGGSNGEPVDITTPVRPQSVTVYSTQGNGGRICGFSFTYIDLTGQPNKVGPWGAAEGQENNFPMNQGEYVNNISGYTADGNGVTSLKFTTNQERRYGPYGTERGAAFSVPLPVDRSDKGAVVGFFGRSQGNSVVALGVYVGLAPNKP